MTKKEKKDSTTSENDTSIELESVEKTQNRTKRDKKIKLRQIKQTNLNKNQALLSHLLLHKIKVITQQKTWNNKYQKLPRP